MSTDPFPRMLAVRQKFPKSPPLDIRAVVTREFAQVNDELKPGASIAIAVGSRGISNLQAIVAAVVDALKRAGAKPFIVPAMGSHGGATPEGQTELLGEYGVTESKVGAPIKASMEVERVATTDDGIDVFCSAEALRADGIVVVNRVKPHTDFQSDSLGSGILKMMVIGLGKRVGAANFHRVASRLGYERSIRPMAGALLRSAPVLCGVAIVEDQFHETASIAVLKRDGLTRGEAELFAQAKRLMPKLPFDTIDLLIVDRIGKNISGSGMDPNITGRGGHDYSSGPSGMNFPSPAIRRIIVRGLTPETNGNAIGIGFADFTTERLVRAMDRKVTYINALTALNPIGAKIPVHFETDRETIGQALASLALTAAQPARVVRIADTLSLEHIEVSEAYQDLARDRNDLELRGPAQEMRFDAEGNLAPLGSIDSVAIVGYQR
jgi:hypothetical protein